MGIHLNDQIDWWFLLPVDCYRQRCMRHVEHTPIERNVEEYGTFWQCMGAHFEGPRYHGPEGPRPSNCQPCFFLRSLSEDVDQLRIQNQNLRKRLVLKLHKCNCLEVRFWRHDLLWWDFCAYLKNQNSWTTTLRQWGVLWGFEVVFGGCMLFSPISPRTNVESKQTKTPESKTASHHAEPSVKWD